ncbi:MAG: hypothetical protein IJ111_04060 [Eggerthellaceae bacterium]|nr:hypothetical protein [Eggerthellaceae bacterium]
MKKFLAFLSVCSAFALAACLAGCVTVNVQKASTESDSDSSSSAEASSSASEASSSAASGSSASASASSAASTGTASYSLGNMFVLDVHDDGQGPVADAVVEIVNTGNVPLTIGASAIKIYDGVGNELVNATGNAIFTGPSYLRVGDIGFIYSGSPIPMPSGYSSSDDYQLTATADVNACKEVWEYPISNQRISDDGHGVPTVTGTVTNDDSENADLIEVTAMFLDNEGNLLGVAGDILVNVAPGASQEFSIDGYGLPVGCTMAMIADYDVIAVGAKF